MRSEKPICTPHRLSEVSHNIAFETVRLLFFWLKIFSLVLLKKIVDRFLFSRFSSPGDRWCGVLGFVPAGSVSSSSTLQTPEQCHDSVYMCSFRRRMSSNYIVTCQSDFISHSSSLFQRQCRNSVRLMHLWSGWNVPKQSCVVHVTDSCQTGRSFWRACRKILMGRQYIIGATGNQTDSVVTFKASVVVTPCFTANLSSPWSHGLCWPNHPHTLWDSIFLNDRLGFSLSPPGLLIILNNVCSKALTREPRTGVGNRFVPVPIPLFAWILPAVIFYTCIIDGSAWLASSQSAASCVVHCCMKWVVGN